MVEVEERVVDTACARTREVADGIRRPFVCKDVDPLVHDGDNCPFRTWCDDAHAQSAARGVACYVRLLRRHGDGDLAFDRTHPDRRLAVCAGGESLRIGGDSLDD